MSTETGNEQIKSGRNLITSDQVAWLLDIAYRYLPQDSLPRVSRQRDMKAYGMLYEIMEIAGLSFADSSARWNGTPEEVRNYGKEE